MARPSTPAAHGKTEGRTAWHVLLARLLTQRAPSSFRVLSEVPLGNHPPRADLLLLRRDGVSSDDDAKVLLGLWGRIRRFALLEYKSPANPLRSGDVAKLLGYLCFYLATHPGEADGHRHNVVMGLAVASANRFLEEQLAFFGWRLTRRDDGYHHVETALFPMVVIALDEVSQVERDELLGVFGHGSIVTRAGLVWWQQQTGVAMELSQMEGYDELVERFASSLTPEQRLAGLAPEDVIPRFTPEQRLAGLAPEERLAGLAPEQVAQALGDQAFLALPDHALRLMPDEAFSGLSADVREAIRRRIGR
jgi:hypothetical protein